MHDIPTTVHNTISKDDVYKFHFDLHSCIAFTGTCSKVSVSYYTDLDEVGYDWMGQTKYAYGILLEKYPR
jgi:hypothetical protein